MERVRELFDLAGARCLVAGGGGGLGEAMSVALGQAGAAVAVVDCDEEKLARVFDRLQVEGVRSIAIEADVTKPSSVEKMVTAVVDQLGGLDVAVNTFGVGEAGPTLDFPLERWEKVIDVNLRGVFLCAQAEARVMVEGGGGSIINVASISGSIANSFDRSTAFAAYSASKAGVILLTKSMAWELAPQGVRVNSLSPGYMKTEMNKAAWEPALYTRVAALTPLGRMGEPWELAPAVVFLASKASGYVTGVDLIIDGGYTLW